ncbi:MAG: alkyl sulfatase [Mycobacterium sp.]|nr:alkyl sulfatase [Mycobacterium sp.]
MDTDSLTLRHLSPVLGVEVRDFDLREPVSEPAVAAILAALSEHLVLVFREQILTPAQQISFMGRLGHLAPSSPVIPGISREHHQVKAVDGRRSDGRVSYWHSDITYMLEPPSATALFARVLPPSGGDTEFASTVAAYEQLSAPLRGFVDTLHAFHDDAGLASYLDVNGPGVWEDRLITDLPPVRHPVVVTNARSGRRGLFVNHAFTRAIDGLGADESDALLSLLLARLTRAENTVRIRWEPGTLVLSDNWSTIHRGINDYGTATRILHKVSLRGARPTGSTYAGGPPTGRGAISPTWPDAGSPLRRVDPRRARVG